MRCGCGDSGCEYGSGTRGSDCVSTADGVLETGYSLFNLDPIYGYAST